MTSLQQVQQLAGIDVDYAGFIFYHKSPRFVENKIDPLQLKALTSIQKVGVFVNESKETILQKVDEYGLNMVQLHGDEAPGFCMLLKEKVEVVKAFRVKGDESLAEILMPYEGAADYFLFDTKAQEYGGTGKKFDWSVLENAAISKPYFLSGGIGSSGMKQVKLFTAANDVFSLDLNSRFETAPGVKDIDAIREFCRNLK